MASTQAGQVAALIEALADGTVEIVDLTQPLSESTPVIKLPPPFANTPGLSRTEISRYDDRGPAWAWYTLTLGEHVGTHLDAPIHWVTGKDGADVGSIPPTALVGPACVIDKTAETEADPGYLLTVDDLTGWEADHGRIPDGAWVLLRTGWGARAQDEAAFLNVGEHGPQTPGPDVEASRWLAGERAIAGFGTETVGIDAGAAGGFDPPFPLHNFLLGAGRLGLTQLANLERLPPAGALLVVSPLRLVGGTGSPSRVYALVQNPHG
ncbi:MAG: cyclase family protein [Solirubrobacterales bacterium]|nr:cyclase family protein [Solirubrobacterales bacterium]MBV9472647.1 cyclase family protein [Solirubrobacterales bacterium]MBV9839030.1 cyclase family protein [Solirubrobacterales bacterium]